MNKKTSYLDLFLFILILGLHFSSSILDIKALKILLGLFIVMFLPGYIFVKLIFDKLRISEIVIFSFTVSFLLISIISILLNNIPHGLSEKFIYLSGYGLCFILFIIYRLFKPYSYLFPQLNTIKNSIRIWLLIPITSVILLGFVITEKQDPNEYIEFFLVGNPTYDAFSSPTTLNFQIKVVNHYQRQKEFQINTIVDEKDIVKEDKLLVQKLDEILYQIKIDTDTIKHHSKIFLALIDLETGEEIGRLSYPIK